MCDPFLIGGGLLTALSTGANMSAQGQVTKARSRAQAAERERQAALSNEAFGLNDQSREAYGDMAGKQDVEAQRLADVYAQQAASVPGSGVPTDSNVINDLRSRMSDATAEKSAAQADALATLRSFGGAFGEADREQARNASLIGQTHGFKMGSQAVLPFELEAANSAGSGLRLFADIAGGLGGMAMNRGLSGGLGGGGASSLKPAGIPRAKPTGGLPSLYG